MAGSERAQSAKPELAGFVDCMVAWSETHGRHDLPWQFDPSPYRVWVSEIMLQQTRVGTVIPYFQRFMARFPDVGALAAADIDQVLHLWAGLGYYARARNLHRAARTVVAKYGGKIPRSLAQLTSLSGIGRSTAGAILALGHDQPAPILDGNVNRVLARCFAVAGYPGNSKTLSELWALAEELAAQLAGDANPLEPRGGNTQNSDKHPKLRAWAIHPESAQKPQGRKRDTNTSVKRAGSGVDGVRSGRARSRIAAYTQGMMDLGATLCTRTKPDCSNCPLRERCLARRQGEVERYPGKKPARNLPVRAVTMFIIHDRQGRVLLEKRPSEGIWGSLYSLPQIETRDGTPTLGIYGTATATGDGTPASNIQALPEPTASLVKLKLPIKPAQLDFADDAVTALPRLRHGFTHFQLDISPVLCEVEVVGAAVADSDRWLWYSIDNPAEVGLAAPVQKLLAALAASGRIGRGERASGKEQT